MKSLPGRVSRRWLAFVAQLAGAAVFVALTLSMLPVLLLLSLVLALALIPALRQLRKEMERTETEMEMQGPDREQMVDVTPLHRRLERQFWLWWQRRR
jgi:membrane protein implicated in regulation of membrane protease activity